MNNVGTFSIDDARREMRKLLEPVIDDVQAVRESVTSLGNTVVSQGAVNFAGITNLLDNSLPEWSKDAYLNLGITPAGAGDDNLECYNFFRQIETATDLSTVDANTLKAGQTSEPAQHTLWAANEGTDNDIPRWDKVNGTMQMGGVTNRWDLFTPLPNDIVFPGQTFYFQLEAKLASASPAPEGVQLYAGLYDDTAGQRKFIEGGNFTITGEIFGTPGATTVEYQILARTDSGEEALSNVLTFTNAPTTFDQNNHPRVTFSGVAGFIQFLIYRKIGTTYVHQYTVGNTIEGTYYDIGNPPIAVVPGFPSITTTVPRAYAVTTQFSPGAINGAGWVRHGFTIFVPTTYDRSVTGAGMQYLRFGLSALTDEPRQILIRRLGLSQGDGVWSRSSNDTRTGAHSSPSTSATGSGSGGGDGGGGVDPPSPPGGGDPPRCVLTDSLIDLADGTQKELQHLNDEYLDGGGAVYGKVRKLKMFHASRIYRVVLEDGSKLGCAVDHPMITSGTDYNGTKAKRLKKRFDAGEEVFVLTKNRATGNVGQLRIVKMDEESGDFLVGTPQMLGGHIYIANGILSHNLKPDAPSEF